jgi:hypothetical protein
MVLCDLPSLYGTRVSGSVLQPCWVQSIIDDRQTINTICKEFSETYFSSCFSFLYLDHGQNRRIESWTTNVQFVTNILLHVAAWLPTYGFIQENGLSYVSFVAVGSHKMWFCKITSVLTQVPDLSNVRGVTSVSVRNQIFGSTLSFVYQLQVWTRNCNWIFRGNRDKSRYRSGDITTQSNGCPHGYHKNTLKWGSSWL